MISRLLLPFLLLNAGFVRAQDNFDPFSQPATTAAPPDAAAPGEKQPVTASLVAEQTAIVPGQKFSVAVKVVHEDHWHIFWRQSGLYGQSTQVDWIVPEGFAPGVTVWPIPKMLPTDLDSVQHVYEGTVYLLGEFTAPATLKPGDKVKIGAEVFYQFCKEDQCRTGEPKLSIELTVADKAEPGPEAAAFDAVRKSQPQPIAAWKTSVKPEGNNWVIRAEPGEGAAADPGTVYFFDAAAAIENIPQKWTKDDSALVLRIKGEKTTPPGKSPWGFLHTSASWLAGSALAVIPVGESSGTPAWGDSSAKPDSPKATVTADDEALIKEIRSWGVRKSHEELTWPLAVLFAFLGGMILNLMPCVFPVLGIKILGFVRQSGENPGVVKKHGLVYAAGVIASILGLAGVLLAVRAGSESAGWGFQLQNPSFLAGLIIVVFAFAISLTGVFEIGAKLTGVGAELQDAAGYKGSFFSGLLTVLLATPCTGPFMGPALGFALNKSTSYGVVLLVFTALAVGLALPYVILSWFPALVKKLPRPGAWMETFKQFMAFPMLATVVWLLYVFAATTGVSGTVHLLYALVLLGIALWLYGRFFQRTAKVRSRTLAAITAILSLTAAGWLAWTGINKKAPQEVSEHAAEPLSPQLIIERRQQGLITVVDFWAKWCLQCELNREAAFDRTAFREALEKENALFMLGDKTTRGTLSDKLTDKFLEAYGQGGIPYALVIPPTGPVIELPSVIESPDVLIKAIEEAKKQAAKSAQ